MPLCLEHEGRREAARGGEAGRGACCALAMETPGLAVRIYTVTGREAAYVSVPGVA